MRRTVAAVVPAHNEAESLPALLDELIKQNYDEIIVIDDASKDDTAKLVHSYKPKVQLIEGHKNVGAGANRNRIIGQTKCDIIHFIDGDMQLLSKNTPQIIRNFKWPKNAAFVGGVVRNPDGTQNPFNFGPRPHLLGSLFRGGLQYVIWMIGRLNQPVARLLRKLSSPLLAGLPNIYQTPRPRRVYWTAESNMLVRSDFFAKHGGFDPRFRYSEIEDLSLRMHRRGLYGYFNPDLDAQHGSWDNVLKSGDKRIKARRQFATKHGRLVYYFPPIADYLEGRKTQKRYHR